MSAHTIGKQGEDIAASYLERRGYTIIGRNYRIRGGEIDLVARKGDEIVFVEVKARSSARYGYPEESVTSQKTRFIARAIASFMRKHRIPDSFYLRFDVIAIDGSVHEGAQSIHHIQNVELPRT
ncbi:MAG: YraN family protein [Patescibacteria group bacterium]